MKVVDYDGTSTDIWSIQSSYEERHAQLFAERTSVPLDEIVAHAAKIKAEVLADPLAAWVLHDHAVVHAQADPYILTSETYRRMLRILNLEDNGILSDLFYSCSTSMEAPLRHDAHLILGSDTRVVSNSKTEYIAGRLRGYPAQVHGGAQKHRVDQSWDAVPRELDGDFPRPVLLRRPYYAEVLAGLAKEGFTPQRTTVIGDIFEFDLALPLALGYSVMLLESPGTRPCEREYLQNHPRGAVVKSLTEAAQLLGEAHTSSRTA